MKKSASSAGKSDARAWLWAACVAVIAGWLGIVWMRGLSLETSVLAMLPRSEQDLALQELTSELSGRASRTLVVLVGHAERDQTLAAAAFVEQELRGSPEFTSVTGSFDAERQRAFFDLYFPHRYAMLSQRMRADLEHGAGPRELVDRVRGLLQGPTSALYSSLLERDPLLLHSDLLQAWSSQSAGTSATEGYLLVTGEGFTYALLTAEVAADSFDANGQRAALDRVDTLKNEVASRFDGARILSTGVPRFAAAAREAMQRDIVIIGTGSMIGTLVCIWLAFRSLRPLILSFLPVMVGTAAAMLVTFLVFDHVHILTLVFGTSLTGLGVDYALHYFAAHRLAGQSWNARAGMRDILPGITLGVLTSVLGFAGLCFTSFPVLRQFALFSSVGLVAAWATVVCWFPPLMSAPHRLTRPPWLHRQSQTFLDAWARLRSWRGARVLFAGLFVLALCIPFAITFDDDVRKFQAPPPELVLEASRVRELAGRADDARFVLVLGATEEETLERLDRAATVCREAVLNKSIESFRDLSLFLPSRARQESDHALLASRLLPHFEELGAAFDDIGFDPAVGANLRRGLEAPVEPLDPSTWLQSAASEPMRPLWLGRTARGFGATIMLAGVHDATALEAALAGLEGVHFVDRVRDLSRLLMRHRIDTTRLVVAAYALVLLVLAWRFGWWGGVRVMLPSLLSAGLTLAILSLTGSSASLFHLLGLLLVLGLAVDYGVIFAERGTSEATALFAVVLSVLTTVTAFWLMALSSAPPLRALGASVSLGLVLALLFSPLACLGARAEDADARVS